MGRTGDRRGKTVDLNEATVGDTSIKELCIIRAFRALGYKDEYVDYTVTSKEQLLQKLIEAHERLIAAATTAFERGVAQEGGKWGPREIMAHIAAWEANAIERVPKIVVGAERLKYDDDAFNAAVITILGNQSFDAIRDILRETYQRDIEMLRALDESVFVPGNYACERTKAAIRHTYEHAQELDERTRVSREAVRP